MEIESLWRLSQQELEQVCGLTGTAGSFIPRWSHFLPSVTQAAGWPSRPHATATHLRPPTGGQRARLLPLEPPVVLVPWPPPPGGVKATSCFRPPGLLCCVSPTFFPSLRLRDLRFPWARPRNLDRPEVKSAGHSERWQCRQHTVTSGDGRSVCLPKARVTKAQTSAFSSVSWGIISWLPKNGGTDPSRPNLWKQTKNSSLKMKF